MTETKIRGVDPNSLRVSEWLGILWGFLWRGLVTTLGSVAAGGILGGILGFVVGLILALAGVGNQGGLFGGILGGIAGIPCGLFFLYLWIRWILRAHFGRIRFALVESDANAASPVVSAQNP